MSQVAHSNLRALYVDFNSYFASAEQQMRPELRGQPIGIVAVMTPSTCCIAASVEAKRFGVKTGTGVRDAQRLCPGIQFIEARPEEYIRLHHRLHEVIESCLPVTAVRSIDEMWCELKGSDRLRANAERLAIQIKEKIYSEVGDYLRCSIGIAPNRYLAKTASNMQKPNGLVVIEKLDLPHVLFRLSLRDLNGIGHAMKERLIANGIDSVEKLCMASKLKLRKAWGGIEGERMWARLRGEWVPDPATEKSSVSHSHVLPPEYRDYTGAFSVAHRLLQRAAARLRDYGFAAEYLGVRVKLIVRGSKRSEHSYISWGEGCSLAATNDTTILLKALETIWANYPRDGHVQPMAVGVVLSELRDAAGITLGMFDDDRHELNQVLDAVNLRYGKNTLYFGGAHHALERGGPRIAFNHIPDLELEQGGLGVWAAGKPGKH